MEAHFVIDLPMSTENPWIRVEGGGLEHPIEVKVALINGRPIVAALRIDGEHEITSTSLRSVRVPDIAKEVVAAIRHTAQGLEPSPEDMAFLKSYEGPFSSDWTDKSAIALSIAEAGAAAMQLESWLVDLADADPTLLEQGHRGRGAKPPTEAELRAFARVLLEERLAGDHGSKVRVSKRLHINRSTVYAWERICQGRGILPNEEKS